MWNALIIISKARGFYASKWSGYLVIIALKGRHGFLHLMVVQTSYILSIYYLFVKLFIIYLIYCACVRSYGRARKGERQRKNETTI